MLREGRFWMVPKSFQDAACERLPRWLIGAMLDDGGHPASEEVVRPQVAGSASPKIKLSILNVLELSLIALLTASVNFPTTELLRMPQSEVIHGLFESCPHSRVLNLGLCEDEDNASSEVNSNLKMSLLFAAGIKFAQTAITFGAAVPSASVGHRPLHTIVVHRRGRRPSCGRLDVRTQRLGLRPQRHEERDRPECVRDGGCRCHPGRFCTHDRVLGRDHVRAHS